MNSRESMLAAFSQDGVPPDLNFPAVLIYEDIIFRDHYLSMTQTPWWHRLHHDRSLQFEHLLERTTTYGQDWVDLNQFGYDYDDERRARMHVGIEHGQVVRRDLDTGNREVISTPVISGEHITSPEVMIRDEKHIDCLIPLQSTSNKHHIERPNSLLKDVLATLPALFRVTRVSSPIWALANIIGYENYLVESVTRPKLIDYACRRLLNNTIMDIKFAASIGADCIFIEECLTDMLSPSCYDVLVVPVLIELNEAIRSLGMKSLMYFTGNPGGKLDLLKKTNPDAFAFEEGKKNFANDIIKIAEYFAGSFTLFGNIDSIGVIENGDYLTLKAEMRRQLEAARVNKNRFVFSQGSPITPSTSDVRIREFFDLAHQAKKM